MTVRLRWREGSAHSSRGGGVYLFLLHGIPFYVGTARSFSNRLGQHERHFKNGERTFVRASHAAPDWPRLFKSAAPGVSWLYLPGVSPLTSEICDEGREFWASLRILCAHLSDDVSSLVVESKLQLQLARAFERIHGLADHQLVLPGTRSRLFGRIEVGDAEDLAGITVVHDWSEVSDSPASYLVDETVF